MRRRVKEVLSILQKVGARRAPFARAHLSHFAAIRVHRVNLIARPTGSRRLKDEFLAVERKIGFRVLAAKGELAQILQVLFSVWLGRKEGNYPKETKGKAANHRDTEARRISHKPRHNSLEITAI